ncbi:MAG: hypothetical protein AB7R89_25680 [Dehalococcoidia bacterium]
MDATGVGFMIAGFIVLVLLIVQAVTADTLAHERRAFAKREAEWRREINSVVAAWHSHRCTLVVDRSSLNAGYSNSNVVPSTSKLFYPPNVEDNTDYLGGRR